MPADFSPLWSWMNERHAIYLRKRFVETGEPPPNSLYEWDEATGFDAVSVERLQAGTYTLDPVLRDYRFCNVFRELDRVTVWIRQNIRELYADNVHLWLMLAIARKINWPPSLQELIDNRAWPSAANFAPEAMTRVLEIRKGRGEKVETGAYMITAASSSSPYGSWSKQRYVCEVVLGKLWEDRKAWELMLVSKCSLEEVWNALQTYESWGPFMAGQVVTDLRHTRYLRDAPDIDTWTALGPGSRRGLNRLHGRDVGAALSQDQGVKELMELRAMAPQFLAPHVPLPELSDFQNSCCEVDKYLRVRSGLGTPRSRYVQGRGW